MNHDCDVCEAGKYSVKTGRSSVCDNRRPAGKYLTDAATDANEHDESNDCDVCEAGKYC